MLEHGPDADVCSESPIPAATRATVRISKIVNNIIIFPSYLWVFRVSGVLLPLENSFSDRLMCKFSILYWVK